MKKNAKLQVLKCRQIDNKCHYSLLSARKSLWSACIMGMKFMNNLNNITQYF